MKSKIPLVHITDLYHPPQDPDDHFDLATLFALEEIDLKAVLLDSTRRFIDGAPEKDYRRDPGFIPVAQMSYLTGKAFPVACGPSDPLTSIVDDVSGRPASEQCAVNLLLKVLTESVDKVMITCVGSARIIAAAFNRDRELMRQKVKSLYLNIGSSEPSITDEWNVNLDLNAWLCLMNSGLDIGWFPCTGEKGPFWMSRYNTFWKTTHQKLIEGLPQKLRAWFHYALTGNQRGDIIHILNELGNGATFHNVLPGERNLWSTFSLVMSAGRILARTDEGWRFVPQSEENHALQRQEWSVIPVKCRTGELGQVYWENDESGASNIRLFVREVDNVHAEAMAEAFHALLGNIRI